MKAILVGTLLATLTVAASAFTRVQCPKENSDDVVLLPNPEDCTTYYACDNGLAKLMKCSEGLHFNAELRVCDWPDRAGCESSTDLPNGDNNDDNDDNNGGNAENNDNGNDNNHIDYENNIPSEPEESILETNRQWN